MVELHVETEATAEAEVEVVAQEAVVDEAIAEVQVAAAEGELLF